MELGMGILLYILRLRYCWITSIPISSTSWHSHGSYSWVLLHCDWPTWKVCYKDLLSFLLFKGEKNCLISSGPLTCNISWYCAYKHVHFHWSHHEKRTFICCIYVVLFISVPKFSLENVTQRLLLALPYTLLNALYKMTGILLLEVPIPWSVCGISQRCSVWEHLQNLSEFYPEFPIIQILFSF